MHALQTDLEGEKRRGRNGATAKRIGEGGESEEEKKGEDQKERRIRVP